MQPRHAAGAEPAGDPLCTGATDHVAQVTNQRDGIARDMIRKDTEDQPGVTAVGVEPSAAPLCVDDHHHDELEFSSASSEAAEFAHPMLLEAQALVPLKTAAYPSYPTPSSELGHGSPMVAAAQDTTPSVRPIGATTNVI